MNDLKAEFSKLATEEYLGDPYGTDAYAYLRASSERQVEEGSSFPRQLESINKAALRESLRVPFGLIFFDDGFTGFEFEHRPALLKLRHETKTKPRANHLVIEDIDRLSRNADWQQGFLLEEFSRHNIEVHFYINPGSQLERYVRGYIAQEGMKKDIERMRMGNLYKAMDGKVTARRPRYGYTKTDPKDSHYVLHPEESKVMRAIYEMIIYEGKKLGEVAKWLNDSKIPTRFITGFWTAGTIWQLVKSPAYKGEFYANRAYQVHTGEFNEKGRPKRTNLMRPKEEWIKVDVPAIVSPAEWDLAQETLAKNATRSSRNGVKQAWLLQGFLKCALCTDFTLMAVKGSSPKSPRRYYACASRNSEKSRMLNTSCRSPYVYADELERRVWEEIEAVIYDPNIIIRRMDEKASEEVAVGHQAQLDYIKRKLEEIETEKSKLEAAYHRDIYTLDEFEVKMKDLKCRRQTLEVSRAKVDAKIAESNSLEEKKTIVLKALEKIRKQVEKARSEKQQPQELPFDLKRRILSTLVEVIWVDSINRRFTIEGEISGVFAYGNDEDNEIPPSSSSRAKELDFASTSTRIWR